MNDQPAFPLADSNAEYKNTDREDCNGMTLRDYFAAKAMQGFCADPASFHVTFEKIAISAYEQADAMLKARAK